MDEPEIITPTIFRNILTRGLPKTGQVTSYRAGDDGIYEAGWWKRRLNANNRTRFIAKTIAGDDVVIDRAIGLMWAADGNEAGCNSGNMINWNDAIDYALALDFAGFTDWRIPNIKELMSILDYGQSNPAINETFFPNTQSGYYWTSTTDNNITANAWRIDFADGGIISTLKTFSLYLRCVRGGV